MYTFRVLTDIRENRANTISGFQWFLAILIQKNNKNIHDISNDLFAINDLMIPSSVISYL